MVNLYGLGLSRLPEEAEESVYDTIGNTKGFKESQEVSTPSDFSADEIELAKEIKNRGGTQEDFENLVGEFRSYKSGADLFAEGDRSFQVDTIAKTQKVDKNFWEKAKETLIERGEAGGDIIEAGLSGEQGAIRTGLQFGANFIGTLAELTSEGIVEALDAITTEGLEESFNNGIKKALDNKGGEFVLSKVQEISDGMQILKENDPVAYRDFKAFGDIVNGALTFLGGQAGVQSGKQVVTQTIKETGKKAGKTAAKLEAKALTQTKQIAEDIAFPTLKELGKRQKGKIFRDVVEEGSGVAKKQQVVRSAREADAIEEVARLLDEGKIKQRQSPIKQQAIVDDEIGNISKNIDADLRASDVVFTKTEVEKLFDDLSKEILENPTIVGDPELAIKKLIPQLKKELKKEQYFPEDLLQIRKNFDNSVNKFKGDRIFDPNTENALSVALKDFRQGINKKIADKVPDANLRRQLNRQSALYEVSNTLGERFSSQANSFVGKVLSNIQQVTGVPRTEIVELATALGLAGFVSPIAGTGVGLFFAGKELSRFITSPAIKKKIATILRKFDEAVKANPNKAAEIQVAKQSFLDSFRTDIDEKLFKAGRGLNKKVGDLADDVATKVGAKSNLVDDTVGSGKGLDDFAGEQLIKQDIDLQKAIDKLKKDESLIKKLAEENDEFRRILLEDIIK